MLETPLKQMYTAKIARVKVFHAEIDVIQEFVAINVSSSGQQRILG